MKFDLYISLFRRSSPMTGIWTMNFLNIEFLTYIKNFKRFEGVVFVCLFFVELKADIEIKNGFKCDNYNRCFLCSSNYLEDHIRGIHNL